MHAALHVARFDFIKMIIRANRCLTYFHASRERSYSVWDHDKITSHVSIINKPFVALRMVKLEYQLIHIFIRQDKEKVCCALQPRVSMITSLIALSFLSTLKISAERTRAQSIFNFCFFCRCSAKFDSSFGIEEMHLFSLRYFNISLRSFSFNLKVHPNSRAITSEKMIPTPSVLLFRCM